MSEKRPLIGLTTSMNEGATETRTKTSYLNAIIDAGGLPVILPFDRGAEGADLVFDEFGLDGILFTGGVDVDPVHYGEKITADNVVTCEKRDEFEFRLARRAIQDKIPILGICRGSQLLNVSLGGTLWQDIPGHQQKEADFICTHAVKINDGTVLRSLSSSDVIPVNSFHHQAVKDVAKGFCTCAFSASDGIVEAIEPIEKTDRFFLAVQWHPERYYREDPSARALFDAFVSAAKRYHAERVSGR